MGLADIKLNNRSALYTAKARNQNVMGVNSHRKYCKMCVIADEKKTTAAGKKP